MRGGDGGEPLDGLELLGGWRASMVESRYLDSGEKCESVRYGVRMTRGMSNVDRIRTRDIRERCGSRKILSEGVDQSIRIWYGHKTFLTSFAKS